MEASAIRRAGARSSFRTMRGDEKFRFPQGRLEREEHRRRTLFATYEQDALLS